MKAGQCKREDGAFRDIRMNPLKKKHGEREFIYTEQAVLLLPRYLYIFIDHHILGTTYIHVSLLKSSL